MKQELLLRLAGAFAVFLATFVFASKNTTSVINSVMLVLGLKAKFCGRGLAIANGLGTVALEVWLWPKIQGQNRGGLQNSPLTSIDSSELYFKIHVPYLLIAGRISLLHISS